MTYFADMTGLASSTSAITAVLVLLPGVSRIPKHYRTGLVCAAAIAALLPFGGLLPLAAYVRGVIGDLSITSLMLLMSAILNRLSGWQPLNVPNRPALLFLVALAALGLYPMALGIGFFDPYRLGYGNPWFMGVLLAVALIACFRQFQTIAMGIALAVLAWTVGWYESNNLWDYLLDPLVSIYAIGATIKHGVQILLKKPG